MAWPFLDAVYFSTVRHMHITPKIEKIVIQSLGVLTSYGCLLSGGWNEKNAVSQKNKWYLITLGLKSVCAIELKKIVVFFHSEIFMGHILD